MNTDYFQSHNISLILSWIFSIPTIITFIVYVNVQLAKNQHWFTGLLLIWIFLCMIVLSPFRYMFLQLIMATTYPCQGFYAFFTTFALSAYIIPFVGSILYGIGLGLPVLGVGAIVGFKDSISKTRLFLAAIAAPFLFLVGSYLFYLVLPYAAYSTHWLRAEDVIRATNGPSEYVYKYLVERWTPQAFPQFIQHMGLENLTSKERLRAHVAAVYLGKKQFAHYVYKTYPEYADRKRLDNKLDYTDKTPQEWPELTNEEKSKIYSITTKMIVGEPLGKTDLEDVRRLQREYIERTGIVRTEEEITEEARIATEYFNIIYQYNSEMDKCLLESFDNKIPYISDKFQSLRKKMEASEIAIKPKLDADIHRIECTANRKIWTDESGQKHNPLSREEILKRFENTRILKDNLQKYIDAIINYDEQPLSSNVSNAAEIDDETRHSIEGFFNGYEHVVSASNLLRGMSSSQDPVEEYKKAVILLNKSKENLIKCKPELLDNVYSDWGDALSNKLIPAIDIYIAGAKPNTDRNKLQRGDELIVEFDAWFAKNWSDILLRLNVKFGYKIK